MFLPDNYESPKGTSENYMKLQEGENRLRILSAPVIGWEDWTEDKKPVRFAYANKPAAPIDSKKPIKHFWAMIVFNYGEKKVQILHVTQATIRKAIEKLCKDSDWGAPYHYDIKVTKEGEGKDTEYHISPVSHKPVSDDIKAEFLNKPIWLEALFENADPFADWGKVSPGIFDKDAKSESKIVDMKISKEQASNLEEILKLCPEVERNKIWDGLHKMKIASLLEIPTTMYERILTAAEKHATNNLPF